MSEGPVEWDRLLTNNCVRRTGKLKSYELDAREGAFFAAEASKAARQRIVERRHTRHTEQCCLGVSERYAI